MTTETEKTTETTGRPAKEKDLREGSVQLFIVINFLSSPLLVFVNKWIYQQGHISAAMLTCIHLIVTSVLNTCLYLGGIFSIKPIPIIKMVPLSITFCGFVVLTNMSLQFNTIGTYQVCKTMTTPLVILIQFVFYNRYTSFKLILTTIPISIGVFLNSYYDVKFNVIGIVFAGIGVVVTSLYQVWVGEKQHEFQVNSMQLLFYQAPLSALLLVVIIPFLEPVNVTNLLSLWPPEAIAMILLSGVVAFSVNLSIYWIIGNTSPVTYNMVGHLKFCLTLLGGFVLFHDTLNPLQILGILTTLSGVIAYTHFKMQENKVATSSTPLPVHTDGKD